MKLYDNGTWILFWEDGKVGNEIYFLVADKILFHFIFLDEDKIFNKINHSVLLKEY